MDAGISNKGIDMTCGIKLAWSSSTCQHEEPCEQHKDKKCRSCGAPATHECGETGQFVCGALLCDECEHAITPEGTNGGIGFFALEKLPEGWKDHIKKTDQKYVPWYMRDSNNQPIKEEALASA